MLTGSDSLRMNATITMVQRDNIWHPYYEIKVEEEDLGTKFRRGRETQQTREGEQEINEIQTKIDKLEQT